VRFTSVRIAFASVVMIGFAASVLAQEFDWTQTSAPNPLVPWQALAASANGRKVVAGANAGGIYTSTNFGATWSPTSAPSLENWSSVASSSDGVKLVAGVAVVSANGLIYTSTNSGANWTPTSAPFRVWQSVASSSDGSKLIAAGWAGQIGNEVYLSTNSGGTWTKADLPGDYNWSSVAASSNGNELVVVGTAGVSDGAIYISTNSGTTWTNANAPSQPWQAVASSSDGTTLAAVIDRGQIYVSTNSGFLWSPRAGSRRWRSIASSSDGTKLAAVVINGGIYTSTNRGTTWTQSGAPSNSWYSIASSSDGTRLFAGFVGGIYTGRIKSKIAQEPQSLFACPGSSAVLGVIATGTPPLSYHWRKNDTNLVDSENIIGATEANLTLLNVSQNDLANYDVVIANDAGSVTSIVATVTVTIVAAKATPIVVNGFIIGVNLLDGGCGYTNPPTLFFSGQGGTGATAYAQISNGSVTNVVVTYAGSGYPADTLVLIAPPLYPTLDIVQLLTNTPSATATPIVTNGFIVGANLTASGSGYPTNPAVSFSDISGHGAAAYSQINNGAVTNIVITSAGSGYSSNAVINISPTPAIRVVIPSAKNLMLGQKYQLQTANDLIGWGSFGALFSATATNWAATNYWNVANTNQLFFRLEMLQ